MTNTIIPITIENEIKNSFLDYSMSVIVSRALPDVRDGLKPVHRRILYAMYNLKNFHNKPFLKSARIVGDVIGKYHPHGDTVVYDALVRMAQNFALRYPLIDGQGNFGSIDGDNAAAMRYTESRMHQISEVLLEDLEKDTVDFVPNYDNKEKEPSVLPAKIPQLLINGSSGIAVGMATNIPPHNITEVIEGLKALIHNPEISIDGLMEFIKGPDFPTSAEIHGIKGIVDGYKTGRGSVIMRAKAYIEEAPKSGGKERIIITEIPYQVNKAKLVERIAELVKLKKVEGITDIRDESAKGDIRVVVDVKRGEPAQIILNHLYKLTPMQSTFGINLVALVHNVPKLLNIKEILSEFYIHRREIILRKTAFLLRKNEERLHLLEGLKIAVESADKIVDLIKKAKDTIVAHRELMEEFGLSEIQAKAVLDMRLARLTGLEREKIILEHKEITEAIQDLRDILATPDRVTKIILEELEVVKNIHTDGRRTQIMKGDLDELTTKELVADEDVAVTVTYAGYVKRTALSEIASQKRGGKGKSGMLMKEEDIIQNVFVASTHQDIFCFTNKGQVYSIKVYDLPEAALRSRGKHFANILKLEEGERVVSVLPIPEFTEGHFVFSITEKGLIKKTDVMAYGNVRSSGIIGLKLDQEDSLVVCLLGKTKDELILATQMGKSIRFSEEDVRSVGRASKGVTGIRFSDEQDKVIGAEIIKKDAESSILSVCANGYGKRTLLSEYRAQSRGGKGIYTIKVTDRNGPVVGICQVNDLDDVMLMTSSGKIVRFSVKDINVIGRVTQGVRLMSVASDEKILSLSKVLLTDDE